MNSPTRIAVVATFGFALLLSACAAQPGAVITDDDVYIVASDGTRVLLPKGVRSAFRY